MNPPVNAPNLLITVASVLATAVIAIGLWMIKKGNKDIQELFKAEIAALKEFNNIRLSALEASQNKIYEVVEGLKNQISALSNKVAVEYTHKDDHNKLAVWIVTGKHRRLCP